MQVIAQACGPIVAGALRDTHGNYTWSLGLFGSLAIIGAAVVLMARRPNSLHLKTRSIILAERENDRA